VSDSTRRSIRTLYQGLIALVIAVPSLAAILPTPTPRIAAIVATTVALAAVVVKVVNVLEDAGLIPAWLKGSDTKDGDR
jgi:hypothetical protein